MATTTTKSWVQKTLGVLGGDPCIRNTRIAVSGLVEWRKLGMSDGEILDNIVGLMPEDPCGTAAAFRRMDVQA